MKTSSMAGRATVGNRQTEKTNMTTKSGGPRTVRWRWAAVASVLTLAMVVAGCLEGGGGGEGERCNPDLSHNECNGSLTCQTVFDPVTLATCGESYCCPVVPTTSSNGYCNGTFEAPPSDGGLGPCPIPAPTSSSSTSSSSSSSSAAPADAAAE
jgi:hypothetical protein